LQLLTIFVSEIACRGLISVQSNASACKKIEVGDELVYVDGHTVVSAVL